MRKESNFVLFFSSKNGRDVSGSDAARSFIFHLYFLVGGLITERGPSDPTTGNIHLPDGRPLLYVAHFVIGRPITFSISCWRIKKNFVDNTIN